MALKFRRLSVPQAKRAIRHQAINSTDPLASQSSHEVASQPLTTGHNSLMADIGGAHRHPTCVYPRCFSRLRRCCSTNRILRAALTDRSLCCVFCTNMHFKTTSSLLKIQSSSVADSVFHVYTFGAEVIWIVCDAINWPGSRSLVMLEPSGFAIGRGCRRLP